MPFAGVGADDAFDVALDTEGVLEHKVWGWGAVVGLGFASGCTGWGEVYGGGVCVSV